MNEANLTDVLVDQVAFTTVHYTVRCCSLIACQIHSTQKDLNYLTNQLFSTFSALIISYNSNDKTIVYD